MRVDATGRRWMWTATVAAALILLCATGWLLAGGTRGAEVANVLALPVGVAALGLTVAFGVAAMKQERHLGGIGELRTGVAQLAGAVRAAEQTALTRLLADTGDATAVDIRFVQPPTRHGRTDGGSSTGDASHILPFFNSLQRGRLVITGPAGSGKTVLAMRLVCDIAASAMSHNQQAGDSAVRGVAVPVRLSASTFVSSADTAGGTTDALAEDLDKWLVEHIVLTYRLPRTTARGLVASGLVLPVIDGVDEMDPPGTPLHRAAILLSALNQPTAQGARAVVLTCRDDRYDDLATAPPAPNVDRSVLQDATIVHIKPMTPSDVHTYLRRRFPDPAGSDRGDPRWEPVLDRLIAGPPDDPVVTALQSPLLLFLAVTAFRSPGSTPGSLVRHLEEPDAHAWLLARLIPALAATRPQ